MDCQQIVPRIYLGSAKASKDQEGLQTIGITHIVNISGKQYFPGAIEYFRFYMKDGKGSGEILLKNIDDTISFITSALSNKKSKILVHCQAGMSRSPAIILAYLILEHKMTLKEAFTHTKSIRPAIRPNVEFLPPLLEIELRIHPTNSCQPNKWPK